MKKFMKSGSVIAALFMLSPMVSFADSNQPATNPNTSNPSSSNPSASNPSSSNPSSSNPSSANPSTPGAMSGPLVIQATQNPAGSFLTDSQGKSIYVFDQDSSSQSKCTGQCAQAWPPLIVQEGQMPKAEGNANTSKISTITREDGTKQLAYNGMPLYYFSGDKKAGDVNGQNKSDFGGTWHLVQPSGDKLTASISPAGGTSANPSTGGAPAGGGANPTAGGAPAGGGTMTPSNPQNTPSNPQMNPSSTSNPSSANH